MREEFDLILVDGGNDIDNGLAFGALQQARSPPAGTTQQEVALKNWERIAPLYESLVFDFSALLVNQYRNDDACSTSIWENGWALKRRRC